MKRKLIKKLIFLLVFAFSQPVLAEEIVMHTVMDTQRNMVMFQIPLPASWKSVTPKTNEDPNIIGPNGIKVYYRSGGQFSYTQDLQLQQIYQQSGQALRPPVNTQQILEQDIQPQLQSHNLQFISSYSLPEIAHRTKTYSGKLYKATASQEYFEALGAEFTDGKGTKALVIIDQSISHDPSTSSGFWYYQLKILEAPDDHFESAKEAFIYSIVNTQDNPEQIHAYNLSEQQKINQSWAQHNARMQQNQQAFERQQQIHRETTNAINDSINSTYNTKNEASDRAQEQYTNVIRDEETITSPHDGQEYQVESGAEHYWINNDGEYIYSDDVFYDPNADLNNNQDWQRVEPNQ